MQNKAAWKQHGKYTDRQTDRTHTHTYSHTYTHRVTNLVERHINVVATTILTTSNEVIIRLTKVRPKRSILVAMSRKIQNSATDVHCYYHNQIIISVLV